MHQLNLFHESASCLGRAYCRAAVRITIGGTHFPILRGRTMQNRSDLTMLRDKLRAFAAERDWEQFHSPKNLSMALMVEVAELMEHFQWLTEAQSAELPPEDRQVVGEELADILLYLVRLSDRLGIDLREAALRKLEKNAVKYPAEQVRGSAKKRPAC